MALHEIEDILSKRLKNILRSIEFVDYLQEIRLRIEKPILVYYKNQEYYISKDYNLVKNIENILTTTKEDVREVLEYISKHSLYAYEEEIRNGYITIEGGHRIGMSGKTVIENGEVKTIRNISCLNIRVSHEVKGCADSVIPYISSNMGIYHTLIISPPKCGKTTLLRDIVRQVSNGTKCLAGVTVGLVDERSEIAGCYRGIPQNDVGIRTDILDGCLKSEGIMMLIRAMSPSIIALDEIGRESDVDAIEYALCAGCRMICTIHGDSLEDIKNKPKISSLIERQLFKRYIVLENKRYIGDIKKIYDEAFRLICELKKD